MSIAAGFFWGGKIVRIEIEICFVKFCLKFPLSVEELLLNCGVTAPAAIPKIVSEWFRDDEMLNMK